MGKISNNYLLKKLRRTVEMIDCHNYLIAKTELLTLIHDLRNESNKLNEDVKL